MKEWGLPKDEFKDNGNWSHQLYIREARRMVGSYVMTEHDCLLSKDTPQSIGMGSYTMDSHNVQRYIKPDGTVQNEGDIGVKPRGPYHIAYGSLVPKKNECQNLLVPVCVSSSHIAFGSIRMEPVFMILGQSSATAAVLAINEKIAVQEVAYDALRLRLLADGQVLESETPVKSGTGIDLSKLKGVVIDDDQAKATGQWLRSTSIKPYVRSGYRHDDNIDQGNKSLRFDVKLPAPGDYEVRHAYSASSNRATNVAITVHHADGVKTVTINQKKTPPIDGLFISLGKFRFEKAGGWIDVSNKAANGYVVVDAIQLVPAK
jgi:hypothetical protein